jgi:hypothetical protein
MRSNAGKRVVTGCCISLARQRLVAGVGETVGASSKEREQFVHMPLAEELKGGLHQREGNVRNSRF